MFVGIDVSKNMLDVCLVPRLESWQVANEGCTITSLVERLAKLSLCRVVVEATGGYERLLVQALQQYQIPVSVVNPKRVRDFVKAQGKLAKTDTIDAEVLALYAKHFHETLPVTLPPPNQSLKSLVALRHDLTQSLVQYKNRLKQACETTKPHTERTIAHLKQQVKDITAEIQVLLKTISQAEVLQAVTGVGLVTVATLLAEMPELGHLSGKEVASLAGLAPFNRDSGQYRGKQFCQGGRKTVRCVLYMAANTARQFDESMKAFFEKLIAKGKPFKVAVTACARKLLVILNAKMRDHYVLSS